MPFFCFVFVQWQRLELTMNTCVRMVADLKRYVIWKSLLPQWKIIYVQLCRKNILVPNSARPRYVSDWWFEWPMLKATVETWWSLGEVKTRTEQEVDMMDFWICQSTVRKIIKYVAFVSLCIQSLKDCLQMPRFGIKLVIKALWRPSAERNKKLTFCGGDDSTWTCGTNSYAGYLCQIA